MSKVWIASWRFAEVGEAMAALASRAGLGKTAPAVAPKPAAALADDQAGLRRFLAGVAEHLDLEAEPVHLSWREIEQRAVALGPALFRLPVESESDPADGPRFLAVLDANRRRFRVLTPAGELLHLDTPDVIRALRHEAEGRHGHEIDALLESALGPPGPRRAERRRARARDALLAERLAGRPVARAWVLRLPPSAPFMHQVREAGLPRITLFFVLMYAPKIAIWFGAWWILWRAALSGPIDWGWMTAWLIVLFTNLPFRLLEPWYGGLFAVLVGWLLKRRLLVGALRLEPEEIRHQGTGQLLSRTIESESAETLTLDSGVLVVSHSIDLLVLIPMLSLGAGGWPHVFLLAAWLVVCCLGLGRYVALRRRWTEMRLDATHDLVEQMGGHQTRLAQEPAEHRHRGEDDALDAYARHSRRMDNLHARLRVLLPGGWLVLSLILLTPHVVRGGFSTAELAASLGGMLFVLQSLTMIAEGLLGLSDAVVVWEKVFDLFQSAARPRTVGLPELAFAASRSPNEKTSEPRSEAPSALLEGTDLVFRYASRAEPVLRGCNVRIAHGDRVLLEGVSGGGKSTLLALLVGLRSPDSGLLLLDGLDHPSLGELGWRTRVVSAPQFHENHVFLGTFAFNLLMGREWPPEAEDFAAAREICEALGLEDLLARMPGGLLQMVGETGWQLSHGEKSRLFIARALLQRADLLAFDESFAALDPENLERALKVVMQRAPTVLVIAHP